MNDATHLPLAAMRHAIVLLSLIGGSAGALAQPAPQCPFSPETLSRHFGQAFKAGVPEPGILGKACTYAAKSAKLWIDAGPNPAPSAEMYRKMSQPPGTTWTAVAGDPDKAVHAVPKAAGEAYPSLSYERKGWLVNITVTGITGKAEIDAWNAKLAQLPRVP